MYRLNSLILFVFHRSDFLYLSVNNTMYLQIANIFKLGLCKANFYENKGHKNWFAAPCLHLSLTVRKY
jgi:hypothetical protein